MKNLETLVRPKTGLSTITKKVASYLTASVICTTSLTGLANAGAVNQGTSAKNTFADGDSITLTGATAITILAGADQLTNMINTNGTPAVLSLAGGNALTMSGSTFSLKGTDDDSIGVTMSGTSTSLILGEATQGTVTILGGSGTSLDVTGADTHTLTFDGSSAFAGTLEVSGDTTFSGAIGGTNGLLAINVDDTKTATFSEAVKATTLTGTGDTVFKKAFTGTTISLAAGKVTFNNTDAVSTDAAITEASGATELAVLNSADAEAPSVATFTGDITVDTITIGATATGGSANVTGTTAGALTVHGGNAAAEDSKFEAEGTHTGAVVLTQAGSGDAIFELGGTTSEVVGAITATSDSDGGFIASATTSATFDAIGTAAKKLLTGSVASGAVATFGAAVSADTLTFTGTATLQENDNASEVIVMADGAILHLDKTIVDGEVVFNEVATTAPDIDAGAKIYMPVNLTFGQTLTMFKGEGDATIGDAAGNDTELDATMQDTALIDYDAELVTDDNGSTLVTANAKTAATTATELNVTTNIATALKEAFTAAINTTVTDTTAEEAFDNSLNAINGMSATEDTALARQVAPQTDLISGSTFAAQSVTGTVQGIMSNRMASLRSGDAYFGTGVSAGGMSAQSGFIQVFGSSAEQKDTKIGTATQAGFDQETTGVAIGFDGISDAGLTVGVSLSTANTDVDGKGTGKSVNSIDTYSASLYMDKATDNGYVEGSLTFGINENSTQRKITSGGLGRTYTGSYDSQSLSLNLSAGVPNEVANGYLTPFGSLTVTSMDIDAYTEKSTVTNDALRLKVTQDDLNSMIGTVGVKYHGDMGNGGTPMISLAVNNEFGDATIDSTNQFQGGGNAFKTTTAIEELSATLGLGYSYGSDAASIEFAYEADVNDDDYLSHYGSIKIVGKF